jgi:short subunit dehydrogenase-like uncharacterized protein
LAARHLAKTYGVNKDVKWAIAGQSQSKLDKIKQELAEELALDDLGYQVSDADIIPIPQCKYNEVILGAAGFTGKLAARHLAKTYGVNKDVKWAIAGQSQSKLDKIKQELAEELALDDILQLDTMIVNTLIASTMSNFVRNTHVVITTSKRFCQYGDLVVEFCRMV